MKSQNTQITMQLSTQSIKGNSLTGEDKGSELSQQHEKCSQKGFPKFACITRSCPNYAFLCEDQSCSCQSLHENCMIVKANSITKNLKSKLISTQSLEDNINQKVDKIIHDLSASRDQLITQIRKNFQLLGLTQWENEVFQKLTKNEKLDATGHQLWQIHHNLKIPQSILNSSYKQISNSFNILQETVIKTFTQIASGLNNLLTKASTNLIKKEKIISEAYKQSENPQSIYVEISNQLTKYFLQSKIVEKNQIERLIAFFESKKIQSTKLLYRASDNKFSVSKFYESCSSYLNTLILCKTQFDKNIGGYTCLDWKRRIDPKKDQTAQSFLFSLTNNDKFTLQHKQRAIYCQSDQLGPDFGASDFLIRELANQKGGKAKINNDYHNSKYKKDDPDSWQRYSGSRQGQFKIKEWQVWHIEFL